MFIHSYISTFFPPDTHLTLQYKCCTYKQYDCFVSCCTSIDGLFPKTRISFFHVMYLSPEWITLLKKQRVLERF